MFTDGLQLVGSSAAALVSQFAGVSAILFAAALALQTGRLAARARAWHNIVLAAYPGEGLRYRHSLGSYLGGIGMNAVLPARPGELLKLALVKRNAAGATYQGLASTLLTESVFDTLTGAAAITFGLVIGSTALGGPLASMVAPLAAHPWLSGLGSLAAVTGVALARRPLRRRLGAVAAGGARGFAVFGHPGRYLRKVVSWQFAALLLRLASIHFFLAAFQLPAGIQATVIVVAVQCAAGLIPLTPNGAGTQQALLVLALGAGASASSIVRFGAGAQVATALVEVVLALVSLALMTGSLHWRRLLTARTDASPEADGDAVQPAALALSRST